jgi:hypothetical protein
MTKSSSTKVPVIFTGKTNGKDVGLEVKPNDNDIKRKKQEFFRKPSFVLRK